MLPVVAKWGRFVFVKGHHITKAQGYFARRGAVAVFVCRFIPGVRHVSSIPAGAAKMPLAPFMVASVVGATIWNTVLLWFGWKFAGNDSAVAAVKHNLDLVGAGLLLLLVAYIWYEVRAAKKAKQEEPTPRS
jgi:membrane protein DedA with SNARE-associated domain